MSVAREHTEKFLAQHARTIDQLDDDLKPKSGEQTVRERILHVLEVFPKISPSMLMVGIGTGIPSVLWHPILDELISEGLVIREQVSAVTAAGRTQAYTRLQLAKNYVET